MRDRYLFSADRKVSECRDLLEIAPGRARILTPSRAAQQLKWILSIVLFFAYSAVFTPLLVALSFEGAATSLPGWAILVGGGLVWLVGLFALFFWWDLRSLPLMADSPASGTELVLLGTRSFGTFQEVRARAPWGEEMHLIVDVRAPRFWEAVRLLAGRGANSG